MRWPLVTGALLSIHAGYWLALRVGFRRARRTAPAVTPAPPVSVIVAARDEARRLPVLLDALVRQTHPPAEVIVVDDASTDGTAEVVARWQSALPALRLVRISDPKPPRKKRALQHGIAAARQDRLVFTDADCRPPPTWLEALARHAAARPEAVFVGYSPFRARRSWLGRLARYETFLTGFLAAGAAGLGHPYTAVGRNLSYRRATFQGVGGFADGMASLSGDDDLFVQHVDRRQAAPVVAITDPASFVLTEAPATWRAWLRGKWRHLSAGPHYRPATLVHLALFQGSGAALWLAPLVAGRFGLVGLGAKLAVQAIVLREAANALQERDLLPALPVLDGLHTLYLAAMTPLGLKPPPRW